MAYKQKGWSPFTLKTEENTPILKKKLGKGIKAEANNDGTIFIDKSVKKGTSEYKKVVNHELEHMNQMESGRADYNDNSVTWEGKKYPRKDGHINYKGKWYIEGHKDLPWEAEAIKAETK
jgi:hypothetical protein